MKRINKIIQEELKKILESMDVTIENYPYAQLEDSYAIVSKLFYWVFTKDNILPREGYNVSGIFAVDGDLETINFYLRDLPEELIKKTASYIKYMLSENGVDVDMKREKSGSDQGDVIRFTIKSNDNVDNVPELNLSNSNVAEIFTNILGFSMDEVGEGMDTTTLISRLDQAPGKLLKYDTEDSVEQMGNVYSRKNGMDYYIAKLDKIREITEFAIHNGYRKIYVA